jgi:hypothetical protein
MKQLLFILLAGCVQTIYGQSVYVRVVDSVVRSLEKRQIIYCADSTYSEFDKDSNLTKADSIRFLYADSRGKNLLMVDEWKWSTGDTSGIVYYFKDKKLIKISASIHSKNLIIAQSFYFKKNKLIFPMNYRNLFEVDDYIERSKRYRKLRHKNLYSSLHILAM